MRRGRLAWGVLGLKAWRPCHSNRPSRPPAAVPTQEPAAPAAARHTSARGGWCPAHPRVPACGRHAKMQMHSATGLSWAVTCSADKLHSLSATLAWPDTPPFHLHPKLLT